MRRSLGFTLLLMGFLLTSCMDGCASRSTRNSAPPTAPSSQPPPHIVLHNKAQEQATQTLNKLVADQNTIRHNLSQFRRIRSSSAGPQFPGEAPTLAEEIVERCNRLEQEAEALSKQSYVREHSGVAPQVKEILKFARDTRNEVLGL